MTIFGYLPYWESAANIRWNLLTHLACFSVEIDSQGDITNLRGWPWTSTINTAHQNGVKVILVVTLFDSDAILTLMNNSTYKNNFFVNMRDQMLAGGADGLNVDFEGTGTWRNTFNTFLGELTNYLHTEIPGCEVTFAGPALTSGLNVSAVADACDGIFIMGYAFSGNWSSNSGANAPLVGGSINITNTVEVQWGPVTQNSPQKLILGVPYYGNHWTTQTSGADSTIIGFIGSTLFRNDATDSQLPGRELLWDTVSQTPWYRWHDGTNWHQVWFDDAVSLGLKYDLVTEHNLQGVGMWALNYDGTRTELWDELDSRYGSGCPPVETTSFSVTVIDGGTENPIENATVTWGGYSRTTNAQGYCEFNNVLCQTSTLMITAAGYVPHSETFTPLCSASESAARGCAPDQPCAGNQTNPETPGAASPAGQFNTGDRVYVAGTGGVGLKAWTLTCSGSYVNKAEGSVGTIVADPNSPQCCGGYTRWKIRWDGDSIDRWSAEGDPITGEYWLLIVPRIIDGRYVFYNNSFFDSASTACNNLVGQTCNDNTAIATDKVALRPGQKGSPANYISYNKSINGIMIDIQGLPGVATPTDFMFKRGNTANSGTWVAAPAPISITTIPGGGDGGSDRIKIIWANNAIPNTNWLYVVVKSNASGGQLGLAADDIFYFGVAIGESLTPSATKAIVSSTDELDARHHPHNSLNRVPVATNSPHPNAPDAKYDYDKNSIVNSTDEIIARYNPTNSLNALLLLNPAP